MPETTATVPMTFGVWYEQNVGDSCDSFPTWVRGMIRDAWNAGHLEGRRAEHEWCKQMIDRHLPEGGPYAEST